MDYLLDVNLCICMYTLYIIVNSIGALLILGPNLSLPGFFLRAYKYGKFAEKEIPDTGKSYIDIVISYIEIPKRWFIHFYLSATVISALACAQMYRVYRTEATNPQWLLTFLDYATTPHREAVDPTSCVIALLLFTHHVFRRLYECLCVSIFGSGKINIVHYIMGHTHYAGVIIMLLAIAPTFGYSEVRPWRLISLIDVIGIIISMLGSLMQHLSLCTMASLRKNSKGEKITEKHVIPEGAMFELVSCPHMYAEIMVYVGIFIVLDFHYYWAVILLFVIINQVQIAIMNHQWYKKTFKDYPIKRKAIFPYLL